MCQLPSFIYYGAILTKLAAMSLAARLLAIGQAGAKAVAKGAKLLTPAAIISATSCYQLTQTPAFGKFILLVGIR